LRPPPSLEAAQRALHALVRDEASPEEIEDAIGAPAARLRVYRRMIRGHVRRALEKCYPAVRAHLSGAAWRELASGYYGDHPPTSFELNHAAAAFPGWLAGQISGDGAPEASPAHVDLAFLEWEALAAYLSAETVPELTTGYAVNPTLSMLSLDYAVVEVLSAWDEGRNEPPPGLPAEPMPSPRVAVIWRHPSRHRVRYRWADDDLLFALKVAHEDLDPGAAALAGGHPPSLGQQAVERAVEAGLLIAH
jgi:hypothetical protein